MRDLGKTQKDYAASFISSFYVKQVDKIVATKIRGQQDLQGLNTVTKDRLSKRQGYILLSYGLYRAGHARLDIDKNADES